MSIFDGYRREESARLEPGDYRVAITEGEETVSRSGNLCPSRFRGQSK